MGIDDRTKDQIIAELHALQQENQRLKHQLENAALDNSVLASMDTESKEYFELIFNTSPDAVIISRLSDSKILKVNDGFTRITGYSREESLNTSLLNLNLWESSVTRKLFIDELLEKGFCENREALFVLKDGTIITGLVSAKTFIFNGVPHIYSITRDISDRKKAEIEKEKTQKLLEESQSIGKIGGWEFNMNSKELTWTKEMYTIHEVDPTFQPIVDKRINFYTPESLPIVDKAVQRAIEHGESYDIDVEIVTARGNRRFIKSIGKPDLENRRLYGYFQDITERKQAEIELDKSHEQLRNFALHLLRAHENERAKIALDIHDSIAQFLIALKMNMGIYIKKKLNGNELIKSVEVKTRIEQLLSQVDKTFESTRMIMNGLRPEQLELLGIVEATESHLHHFEEMYHIKCRFENTLLDSNIHPDQAIILFRILQEAFTNIHKHACATLVTVTLTNINGNLVLEIADNGVGFDANYNNRSNSYGLISMQELAKSLDGSFNIDSGAGEGTKVRVEIPY